MFGGSTRYVETLDSILGFVETHQPTTDELVDWHRTTFSNVSSSDSIMRRVSYLQQVGFLQDGQTGWKLGSPGTTYVQSQDMATLLQIMSDRNVGLRSLLYALSAAPMSIAEISDQQLDTHPELGWSRGQTDMAKQRANWLRSMGLVERHSGEYGLTAAGRAFVTDAVGDWADPETPSTVTDDDPTAGTYETTVHARAVDPEFRATVLSRHDRTCPVSGIDHPGLLDVAHVLSWGDHPDLRADLSNVIPLSKTHHAAFDRGLFTIDRDYRLRVNPAFETQSEVLQRTIIDRAGTQVQLPDESVDAEYVGRHNATLEWA
jgi:putative restriction endonuclease